MSPTGSLRDDAGIGAGGRGTLADPVTDAPAALAGWAAESVGLVSTGRASTGRISMVLASASLASGVLTSGDRASASTGRGRGNGLAGAAIGSVTLPPNIGDGCRPACMKIALATMATTATH